MNYAEITERLAQLRDPAVLAANRRRGDAHGLRLSALRALAKEQGKDHQLALELWGSGDAAERLLAALVCRPREFRVEELEAMLCEADAPKVHEWWVNYVAKKHPRVAAARGSWRVAAEPALAAAGWALSADAVAKGTTGVGEEAEVLLEEIETRAPGESPKVQWEMNTCLAQIGIHREEYRTRALDLGVRLGMFRDYPTPAGCVSPYVPVWIEEMVRRRG